MQENFSIINTTKDKLPRLSFLDIKNDILGKRYNLSIVFIDSKKSKELNSEYRKINKPTNILSFSYSKTEGEILLCIEKIKKETKKFNRTFLQLLGFLVIHGCLHLKGFEHNAKMEVAEQKYDTKYFHRNRCGDIHHKSSSGRIYKRRKKS